MTQGTKNMTIGSRNVTFAVGVLIAVALVGVASAAEPSAVLVVTEHHDGLYALDASKSVGSVSWDFGAAEPTYDATGKRAAVWGAGTCVVLVAAIDGKVSIKVVHLGKPSGPPPAGHTLAGKVRRLATDLPADERQQIAKIYAHVAAQFRVIRGDNPQAVRDLMQAVIDARSSAMAALTLHDPKAWNVFHAALAKLLRAENLSSVDPQAHAKACEAVAGGLK